MKAYLAGGWFTPESAANLDRVRAVLKSAGVEYFDPKNDNLFKPGMSPHDVVKGNIEAINECDIMVACVDRFERDWDINGVKFVAREVDVGTAVEVGIAIAFNLPLVHVWFHGAPGERFNLMLAATGTIAKSDEQLHNILVAMKNSADAYGEELDASDIE